MSVPLLIENGTVMAFGQSPAVLANHSVVVEGGCVSRIVPKAGVRGVRGKRIDAAGKVVLPGLINAHTHCYSAFARGLTKARPADTFAGVLKNLWWRLDSALTTEDCYYSALITFLDCIRQGTTTVIDHHASPNAAPGSLSAIERAVKATGVRACLCYEVSDRNGRSIAREGLEENASFIRHCQRQGGQHIRALFGLHASFTLTDRTLTSAAKLGRDLTAGFHIHVAEAASDQELARRRFGEPVVKRLARFGILGPQSLAAHCVHVSRAEMDLLAETQTAVVHNPQSNLNNAVGIADLVSLAKRGVRVGLGTDAMTANMLEELRVGLWAQHLRQQDPSTGFSELTAALVVNNPKIASEIFGLRLGELREGSPADIILVDYDPPTPLASKNHLGHLVFGISQAPVDTTIVAGKVLMRNRRVLLDIDEARVNARARELARKLWQRF